LNRLMGGRRLKPKNTRLSVDIAGQVEAVGRNVKQVQPDGELLGMVKGGFAEHTCATESALVLKPNNNSFEAAAAPMAAITTLQGLREERRIQSESIYGAEVIAVCSTRNLGQARSIGADYIMDDTQNGQQYALILAANGYHLLFAHKRALTPRGIYVMAGGRIAPIFQSMLVNDVRKRG
jgi:NADPH:quinone reductase-like Zn-dependent oxidoreductase